MRLFDDTREVTNEIVLMKTVLGALLGKCGDQRSKQTDNTDALGNQSFTDARTRLRRASEYWYLPNAEIAVAKHS